MENMECQTAEDNSTQGMYVICSLHACFKTNNFEGSVEVMNLGIVNEMFVADACQSIAFLIIITLL